MSRHVTLGSNYITPDGTSLSGLTFNNSDGYFNSYAGFYYFTLYDFNSHVGWLWLALIQIALLTYLSVYRRPSASPHNSTYPEIFTFLKVSSSTPSPTKCSTLVEVSTTQLHRQFTTVTWHTPWPITQSMVNGCMKTLVETTLQSGNCTLPLCVRKIKQQA